MQRKAALVGANIERFATSVAGCGRVIQPLIEKRACLLSGGGVVVKGKPIQVKNCR